MVHSPLHSIYRNTPRTTLGDVVWKNKAPHVRAYGKVLAIRDTTFWDCVLSDNNDVRRRRMCAIAAQLEPACAFKNDVEFRRDVGCLDVL